MTVTIETKGLTKAYGDLVALEPLDLTVDEGELVMLVGPNGSGKTTFLRLLTGLLEATGGEALIDGQPAGSLPARAALSFIADNPVLYDDLTVTEHLQFVARLHGVPGDEAIDRAQALIREVNLSARADDLPSRFSRGLRQKTGIALGLIRPFTVLLVDEPFVGLDQPGKEAVVSMLGEARSQGATVVVATHSLEFAGVATRCLGLRDGALAYDGAPSVEQVTRLVS